MPEYKCGVRAASDSELRVCSECCTVLFVGCIVFLNSIVASSDCEIRYGGSQ